MQQQTYDIDQFLHEVQELLRIAGLEPGPPLGSDQPKKDVAAGMLLRAFGVRPVMDQVEALARSADLPAWSERDARPTG